MFNWRCDTAHHVVEQVLHDGHGGATDEVQGEASVPSFDDSLTLIQLLQTIDDAATVQLLVGQGPVHLEAPLGCIHWVAQGLRDQQTDHRRPKSCRELLDEVSVVKFVEPYIFVAR